MAIDRFYLPEIESLQLQGEEAHHCLHVLRHRIGDRVVLFNGKGGEVMGEIIEIGKDVVRFKKLTQIQTPQLPWRLILAQAIPKGKQMDWIIQKATELGVAEIFPLISERTVVQVEDERAESKLVKWRQVIIEAAKQCGQNWLPLLHPVMTARAYFETPAKVSLAVIGSLQSDARAFKKVFEEYHTEHHRAPSSACLLIGPEGDFSPAELSRARSIGCQPVTLGRIILRSETAALVGLSVLAYELQNAIE